MKQQKHRNLNSQIGLQIKERLSSWPQFILLLVTLLINTSSQKTYAQCCPLSTLNISTGYNPNTGGLNGFGTNDSKWNVCAVSPQLAADAGAATGSAWVINPGWYVSGGYWASTTTSSWINCFNSNSFAGVTGHTYWVTFCRTFTLCKCATITFNLNVADDNWISDLHVDGLGSHLSQSSTAVNYHTPVGVSFTENLCAGTHTIYVTMNEDDVAGNGIGFNLGGSITASVPSIYNETSACASGTACADPIINGLGTLCAGAVSDYTGTIAGGTWSVTTSTSWATINSAGHLTTYAAGAGHTVVIKYVDPCGRPITKNVTLTTIPPVPTIGGDSVLCSGATLTYTGSTTSSTSQSWSVSPSGVVTPTSGTGSTFTMTGIASGTSPVTATVIYTVTNSCGSNTKTKTVTVMPTPTVAPYANPNPVCAGSPFTIYAVNSTGSTVTWSHSGFGPAAATSTPSQTLTSAYLTTGTNTGTYTVNAAKTYAATSAYHAKTCTSANSSTVVTFVHTPSFTLTSTNFNPCAGTGSFTIKHATGSAAVVSGTTYSTTGTGPGGYTYSSTAALPLAITTPSTAGTYTYTVTEAYSYGGVSCPHTETITITVMPSPTVAPSASPDTLCVGSSFLLNANNSSGSTVLWTHTGGGPAVTSTTASSQTLTSAAITTGTSIGNYNVTATLGGCTATGTIAVTFVHVPSFTLASAPAHLCAGQGTLTIKHATGSAAVVAGTTYSTTGTGPGGYTYSSTAALPLVFSTPSVPGTYTYTVTEAYAYGPVSCPYTQTISVIVDSTPTVSPSATPNPLCAGSSFLLDANNSAGSTVAWTHTGAGPGVAAPTVASQTLTSGAITSGTAVGTYNVTATYTSSLGTCSTPGSVAVTFIYTPPAFSLTASTAPFCVGGTYTISSPTTPLSGTTYSWTGTGPGGYVFTSSAPPPISFTPTVAGAYTFTLTETYSYGGVSCPTTKTITIKVAQPPLPPTAFGDTVCQGSSMKLKVSPTIAGLTYSWTGPYWSTPCPGTLVSSTTPSVVIPSAQPCANGIYCVTAISTASGCVSAPTCVNGMVVSPTAAFGTFPSCVAPGTLVSIPVYFSPIGSTIKYTSPAGTFSVTPASSPYYITFPMPVGPATVTLTSISYTLPSGAKCLTNLQTSITINPIPATPVIDPIFACVNGNMTLHATTSTPGTATYSWTGLGVGGIVGVLGTATGNPLVVGPVLASYIGSLYCVTATIAGCTSAPACAPPVISVPYATFGGTVPPCPAVGSVINIPVTASPVGATLLYSLNGIVQPPIPVTGSTNISFIMPDSCVGVRLIMIQSILPNGMKCDSTLKDTMTICPQPAIPVAFGDTTCQDGIPLTISATSSTVGVTYSWAGPYWSTPCPGTLVPSTGATVTIPLPLPCATGTYTVTTTLGSCSSSATCSVYVVPTGTASVTSTAVCPPVGSLVPFTITFSPSPAYVTYSYTGGPTITTSAPVTSPYTVMVPMTSTPMVFTVSGITWGSLIPAPNGTGCYTPVFATYTVNPMPNPPTIDTIYACKNGIITLHANGVPTGAIVHWTGLGITGSGIGNPITVSPALMSYTGSPYCATVSLGGCTTAPFCMPANVFPTPWATISGPTSTCLAPGSVANITVTFFPPGSSFTYSVNGAPFVVPAGVTSPYTFPVTMGSTPLTVVLQMISHTWPNFMGKCDSTILDTLKYYPEICPTLTGMNIVAHSPVMGSGSPTCTFDCTGIISGSVLPCFTASYTWTYTYMGIPTTTVTSTPVLTGVAVPWMPGGPNIATITLMATFTDPLTGIVCPSPLITKTLSCMNEIASYYKPSGQQNTSIINISDGDIDVRLVPNPNKGVFSVIGTVSGSLNLSELNIDVVNILGQVVYTDVAKVNDGKINLSISLNPDLPNGLYMLRLKDNGDYHVIRFSLER